MPRHPLSFLLLAGAAIAAPAAATVSDFRLPPEGGETPDVQGPVLENSPRPTAPRPTPTPTPAPQPTIVVPTIEPSPTATPRSQERPAGQAPASRSPAPAPAPTELAPDSTPTPFPAEQSGTDQGLPVSPPPALPVPQSTAPAETPESDGIAWWIWLSGAFATLIALVAFGLFLRNRAFAGAGPHVAVPQIERPRVQPQIQHREPVAAAPTTAPAPAAAAPPSARPASALQPLELTLAPQRLSLTLMAATLAYRLTVTNNTPEPMQGIEIGGDLIAAHASVPREQLLAGPQSRFPVAHRIETLAPGESVEVSGELRQPIPQIIPIQQGNAVLYVPLVRFVGRCGNKATYITATTGQMGPSGGLLPVRLDLGPRIYNGLASRSF